MFKNKSIYALNKKDPNAIVYVDATGKIERLKREDFTSEAEFLKWKELSDKDYHVSEKETHVYSNHTLSLERLSGRAVVQSPEVEMINRLSEDEYIQNRTVLLDQVRRALTETQYRRLWMYYVKEMSEKEIATQESVGQKRISKSILAGKRAVEKIFCNSFRNRG